MDDSAATITAALIGAGAAVVIGLIGALAGALPVWSLEKRQARKESRDEVRRLLALLIQQLLDYGGDAAARTAEQKTERGMQLISLSAQLGLVLRPREAPVLHYATSAVRLVVTREGHGMTETIRLEVAATFAQDIADWFRGTKSIGALTVDADRWNRLSTKILLQRNAAEPSSTSVPEG